MADAEEPQPLSLKDRIAALQLSHLSNNPGTPQTGRKPPPPIKRVQSTQLPITGSDNGGVGNLPSSDAPAPTFNAKITANGQVVTQPAARAPPPSVPVRPNGNGAAKPPPPALPARTPTSSSVKQAPNLPPRRPSELNRKGSQESVASTTSSISTLSLTSGRVPAGDTGRIRAPPFDPASLPKLPPRRPKQEEPDRRYSRESINSLQALKPAISNEGAPPALPRRTSKQDEPQQPQLPARRRLPPTDVPVLPQRTQSAVEQRPAMPQRPTGLPTPDDSPPPIPWNSRPDAARVTASKERTASGPAKPIGACLACRDFSAPDAHAAKFPRESVPSIAWLADQLTRPFDSATDKARAIFTWLHHNIDYNVDAFFNNRVKGSTPQSTLETGLAVCEGYGALFVDLATKAGLSAIVVVGHGKGFGYTPLKAGEPCPPESATGHAWAAVQIDNGEWHLTDPCWGAGHVQGKGLPYVRKFSPSMFTMTNEAFGRRHFPSNPAHFFREDGRRLTWQQYYMGESVPGGGEEVQVYSEPAPQEGFDIYSFTPRNKQLILSRDFPGPTARFSFTRICRHWDPLKNGEGGAFTYMLLVGRREGKNSPMSDYHPFQNDGYTWWIDIDPRKLGEPGDEVVIATVETIEGKSARGMPLKEVMRDWGYRRVGKMSFVACWEIA